MTLRQLQSKFAHNVILLMLTAEGMGYEVTLGDAYRDPDYNKAIGGHPKSLHTRRLAIDLNLFRRGKYLKTTEAYRPLGEWWEARGGAWGGRFDDGNHFSFEYEGVK